MYCLADPLNMLFSAIVWLVYMFVYMVSFEECISSPSELSRMASYSIFITQIGEKNVPHPYKFMFTWNLALGRGEEKLKKVTIWWCCYLLRLRTLRNIIT